MIAGIIIVGAVGILFIVLGWLLWKKEMITLMHDYHVNKVSEENKAAFCKLAGIGLLVIGLGAVVTAILLCFSESPKGFIAFAIGFVIGLALMIAAGRKYNR